MEYKLLENGDDYEIKFWPFLGQDFPNYEVLWRSFIVPLTNRTASGGIDLKQGLDPILENLVMAHYSTFYHLGVAAEYLLRSDLGYSEDILFHLSASSEMVDRFVHSLVKLMAAVLGDNLLEPLQKGEKTTRTRSYWKKNYQEQFKRFYDRGQSALIPVHNIAEVSKIFWKRRGDQALKDYNMWLVIVNQVRHYRNTLAHNPRLGMLIKPNSGIVFVPKEKELHKYVLWSSVVNRLDNTDFVPIIDTLKEFQSILVFRTNSLWTHAIEFLEEIPKSDVYASLIGKKKERLTETFPQEANSESRTWTSQSGTSSLDIIRRWKP